MPPILKPCKLAVKPGGACMAGLVNVGMMAALLSRSPVAVVLFVVFAIIGMILAIGAMIAAP